MKKQVFSPRCSNKPSISKISRQLHTVKAENTYLKQELSSINKEREKCQQKTKEFNRLLFENDKKLSSLEAELKQRQMKKPGKKPFKQVIRKKVRKMMDLIHKDENLSNYFSMYFRDFDIDTLSPQTECFINFITAILKKGSFKFKEKFISVPVAGYDLNSKGLKSDSENYHDSRLAQLHQEITENLSRTKQVLNKSYASSPITISRSYNNS